MYMFIITKNAIDPKAECCIMDMSAEYTLSQG